MVDYFAVMGLKRSASDREIKEAYRRLAKLYHPDSNPDPDAARMMQIINAAKDVLFDPIKREEHRVRLAITERPFHSIPDLSTTRCAELGATTRARDQTAIHSGQSAA